MHSTPTADLIGSNEASERLGIDRSTLSRWVAAGRIAPVLKLPTERGAFLFDPAQVDQLRRELRRTA